MTHRKTISVAMAILATMLLTIFVIALADDDNDNDDRGSQPPPRFTLLFNDEVVRDNETGLEWPRIPNDVPSEAGCIMETDGNRLGWRRPFIHELASIFNPDPDAITIIKLAEGFPFDEADIADFYHGRSPEDGTTWCINTHTALLSDIGGCPSALYWCVRAFNSGN